MTLAFSRWVRLIEEISGHTLDGAFPGIAGLRIVESVKKLSIGSMNECRLIIYTADKVHQVGFSYNDKLKAQDEYIARDMITRALRDYPERTKVHKP
jgi:hypothetical protein